MSNIKTLQKIRPVKKQIKQNKIENKQKQEENKTAQSNE